MSAKRVLNLVMAFMMLVTSFAISQPAGAASEASGLRFVPPRLDAPHVNGEIVVAMADAKNKSLPAVVADAFATAAENDAQVTRLTASGTMVLEVDENQLASKLDELNRDPNILFAEPNYTFSLPKETSDDDGGYKINSEYVIRSVQPSFESNWSNKKLVSIADLKGMQVKSGPKTLATYPNDPNVFQNYGWTVVGADIVWSNTTASPGVCVIDTGVDTKHPDLSGKTLPGYDFVWGDSDPQDDNGHGTHVAGIIAATQNNKIGIVGASNAKIAAIKVLDAQGVGTNFDIAAGIYHCANRSDVKVINMSLGSSSPSNALRDAIQYAVNDVVASKRKLVVVAAGNDGSINPTYPAGYADTASYPLFANKVISVAASGKTTIDGVDYDLPYPATNYGNWVSVVAPGGSIYSTTPYDKSFYLNTFGGLETRWGTLSGTSMAAPFVSAAAARYWGYKPTSTNDQVGAALKNTSNGEVLTTGAGKWDAATMTGKVQVNIAKLMERGALIAGVYDASTGTPLKGAVISAYQGNVSRGSATIATTATTDIINLPVTGGSYTLKVNKSNYTTGTVSAFQHEAAMPITAGTWTTFADTAVPPKSVNFTIVLVWKVWQPAGGKTIDPLRGLDLDMDVWLPNTPNSTGVVQPSTFIVGNQSDDYNTNVGSPYGAMSSFPYARLVREGGYIDDVKVETMAIRNRFVANAPATVNVALPFYPDTYSVYVTDYGQTIDYDNDGCGDNYGRGAFFDPGYDNTCGGSGTPGIPIMGTYLTPYIYVWKDGALTKFSDGSSSGSYWATGSECNDHWWKALNITSGLTDKTPTYADDLVSNPGGECDKGGGSGTPDFFPYLYLPQGNSGIN